MTKDSKEMMRRSILYGYQNGRKPHNKGKTKENYIPLSIVSKKMIGNKNPAGNFGKLNPMYGRKNPHLIKLNKSRIGIPISEDTKQKMSIRAKASWVKTREKRISGMIKTWCKHLGMTYLEKKMVSLCKKYSLPFRYVGNGKFWITSCGAHINPDFVDTIGQRIVIEVYARCWKSSDYESVRKALLASAGYRVIFFDEVAMDSINWESECLRRIQASFI